MVKRRVKLVGKASLFTPVRKMTVKPHVVKAARMGRETGHRVCLESIESDEPASVLSSLVGRRRRQQ
jgi:hypothetical protein